MLSRTEFAELYWIRLTFSFGPTKYGQSFIRNVHLAGSCVSTCAKLTTKHKTFLYSRYYGFDYEFCWKTIKR